MGRIGGFKGASTQNFSNNSLGIGCDLNDPRRELFEKFQALEPVDPTQDALPMEEAGEG
jgi:hypothetical protein